MMNEVIKIAVLLIISGMLSLLLKQYRPEIGVGITVAAAVTVAVICLKTVSPTVSQIGELLKKGNIDNEYFYLALKSLGIAYISSFAAETCRDLGQHSLAAKAEFAGKCAIFILALPLLSAVLETALELVDV